MPATLDHPLSTTALGIQLHKHHHRAGKQSAKCPMPKVGYCHLHDAPQTQKRAPDSGDEPGAFVLGVFVNQ
ncbi:MAG: hypothetical protein H7A55_22450 [Verrucomicrobiaceae bacterium]|nr:hypothetical protein [Verrucomicrobiaceae bacterium]